MLLLYAILAGLFTTAHSHGQLVSPRSRNWVAHEDGADWGSFPGVPPAEYCYHCLNSNTGTCGNSGSNDYDEWLDTQGNPMPWNAEAVYTSGDVISIRTTLTTHHGGHAEVKACPNGRDSTQECFDSNKLEFVRDVSYNMPADPNYPERGYYSGWNTNERDFWMEFRLPPGLFGDQVLLQWHYVTANSCSPAGYQSYFQGANSQSRVLPSGFWADRLRPCTAPYPQDGTVGAGFPEQFWNCAEIKVLPPPPTKSPSPVALTEEEPTVAPVSTTTYAPTGTLSRMGPKQDSRMIAYVANWQSCPSLAQLDQYSHIVIAFATSYTWSAEKNICSSTCEIATPPVCNNAANPTLINGLRQQGKKVILSFGGAGMGGSWESSVNDCWESCFGRETQTVDRLVEIVEELGIDGVDIDFEYYVTTQAVQFLKEVTFGLRNKLPPGFIVTHAPMDADIVEGAAYFELLKEVSHVLDFVMPQYYNGVTRPILDGFKNAGQGKISAAMHFSALVNDIFDGDATKVVFGFCIDDCSATQSNSNALEAAALVSEISDSYYCHGGVFFWVAADDMNGAWSSVVNREMEEDRGCSGGLVVIPKGSPSPTVTRTDSKPPAPEKETAPSLDPGPSSVAPAPLPATDFDDSYPCCPAGFTGLRAMNSCSMFHHCLNGIVASDPVVCNGGLMFDSTYQICNWPQQVTCKRGEPCYLPSAAPSPAPTALPTLQPSFRPSVSPSTEPSTTPTGLPTLQPSFRPSVSPSTEPSTTPTGLPTLQPSFRPSVSPSTEPSTTPTGLPTLQPSFRPIVGPNTVPSSKPVVSHQLLQPSAAPSLSTAEEHISSSTDSPSENRPSGFSSISEPSPPVVPTPPDVTSDTKSLIGHGALHGLASILLLVQWLVL